GRPEALHDLKCKTDRLRRWNGAAGEPFPQGLAFKQFGDHVRLSILRTKIEYYKNIGMIQGASGPCFLLKTAKPVRITRIAGRHDLDRNLAPQPLIPRPVDDSHAARTQFLKTLVVGNSGSCHGTH